MIALSYYYLRLDVTISCELDRYPVHDTKK